MTCTFTVPLGLCPATSLLHRLTNEPRLTDRKCPRCPIISDNMVASNNLRYTSTCWQQCPSILYTQYTAPRSLPRLPRLSKTSFMLGISIYVRFSFAYYYHYVRIIFSKVSSKDPKTFKIFSFKNYKR